MNKKHIIGRRIATMLLMLAMIFGEFAEAGINVFAADDEQEKDKYEDGETAETDAFSDIADTFSEMTEDVLADEIADDHAAATWVRIVTSGGKRDLRTDSDGYYSGNDVSLSNGVLKLNNYKASDNTGGYAEKNNMGGNEEEYYGIYANGDLIIELEGENSLQLGLSRDVPVQNGIYVKGSLTIRNAVGKNGSLDLDLNGNPGSGKANTTYGVLAYDGRVRFEEQNGGKLAVNIGGGAAKKDSGSKGWAYGIKADGGSFTITGGSLNINPSAGEYRTYGISSRGYIQSGGNVSVSPSASAGSSENVTVGIYSSAAAEVSGGELYAKSNDTSNAERSVGVAVDGSVTVKTEIIIEGGSSSKGQSIGLLVSGASCKLNQWAKATMKGDDYALLVPAIDMDGYAFVKPVQGVVKFAFEENIKYYTVCDPEGKAAKEVQFDKMEGYPLWIGDQQVNDSNKTAIPGVDGSASYDPSTGTLYLKDISSVKGGHFFGNDEYCRIYSSEDLIIEIEGDNDITATAESDVNYQYGIYVKGKLNIRNASGKSGSLSLDQYNNGKEEYKIINCCGIYSGDALIVEEISGGTTELNILENIVESSACGLMSGKSIEIKGGILNIITMPASAILSYTRGISVSSYSQSGGTVNIEPYKVNGEELKSSNYMYCVEASNIYVSGGELNAHAGWGSSGSYGILCNKSLKLEKDAGINAFGGKAAYDVYSYGIYGKFSYSSGYTMEFGGKLHAAGKKFAVATPFMPYNDFMEDPGSPFSLADSAKLLRPAGGKTDAYELNNNMIRRFIGDADGNAAAEVLIGFDNLHEVKFDLNGKEGKAPDTQYIEDGKAAREPSVPTSEGYIFLGWYKEKACKNIYSFSEAVKSDIILYAKWGEAAVQSYTVSFDMNGHGEIFTQTVEKGKTASEPSAPEAEGYEFGGWYKEQSCKNAYDFSTPVNGNITLYAKWTIIRLTVTFYIDGVPSAVSVDWGAAVDEPDTPEKAGFDFEGWFTESSCINKYNFETAVKKDISLYAGWKERSKVYHTVTFDMKGHGAAFDISVEDGEKVKKPADPKADGYEFEFWCIDEGCNNVYDFDQAVTEDFTLYAKWAEAEFTVTFDGNGHGTAPEDQTVKSGGKVQEPDPPTAQGFDFGGWFTDPGCTSRFDFDTAVTGSFTLYAKWIPKVYYTVTFNMKDHGSPIAAKRVEKGQAVEKPGDPDAEGYIFSGWCVDPDCNTEYGFGELVTSDITLYAKWTVKQFNVTFYPNNNSDAPYEVKVDWGTKVSRPEAVLRNGYEFDGWYTDEALTKEYDFDILVKESISLFAKWAELYTVSFDNNGYGTKPEDQKVKKGRKAAEPAALEEENFIFGGWYKEATCENRFDFGEAVNENITLYALWTEKKADTEYYTVSFDLSGKDGTAPSKQVIEKGGYVFRPADPEVEGCVFKGWHKDDDSENIFDFDTAVTEDILLIAKWEELKYTVCFDANGHGTAPGDQSIKHGEKVIEPVAPEVEGYIFGGWFKEAECEALYDFENPVKADMTLYAFWTKKEVEPEPEPEPEPEKVYFTVKFAMNGHGKEITDKRVEQGLPVNRPSDPREDGYIFGGWYTDPSCKDGTEYDFLDPVNSDLTLYAKWTAKTDNPEGGRSALDSLPFIDDKTEDIYLVKGQSFNIGKGWYVSKTDKDSRKIVSISKKGVFKAKKAGEAVICYEGSDRTIKVHVSVPSLTKSYRFTIEDVNAIYTQRLVLFNDDDLPVYWYSAAPDVATVDQDGKVTAVAKGKAKITAYINGKAYNCTVTVKERVTPKKRTLHMIAGKSKKLTIIGYKNPVWISSDENVCAVEKGRFKAVSAGTAVLSAQTEAGVYTVNVIVEDINIKQITSKLEPVSKNKYKLYLDKGEELDIEIPGVKQSVIFKSSKTDIAFVDEKGHVTARKEGTGKFSTKIYGKTITINVVVRP